MATPFILKLGDPHARAVLWQAQSLVNQFSTCSWFLCDLGVSQGILASPRSNTGAEVQAPYSGAGMKAIARFQRASERAVACKRRSIPIREIIRSGMELRSFAL